MIINANKVILENLMLCINFENSTNKRTAQPIRELLMLDCDWSRGSFIKGNFSTVTQNNQNFRNDFVAFIISILPQ